MTIDEMVAVMIAYKEGKLIECRLKNLEGDTWQVCYNPPAWSWNKLDYRIKPEEPKPKYINIDKAVEWFGNYLFDIGYPDDWVRDSNVQENGEKRFRKAMMKQYNINTEESKPIYQPFQSAEEVMEAIKEHGEWMKAKDGTFCKLKWIFPSGGVVVMGINEKYTPKGAMNDYIFADGTPFGKRVKE